MSVINFGQFLTKTPLITSDFIVGYQQDGPVEIKATLKEVVDLVSNSGELLPISGGSLTGTLTGTNIVVDTIFANTFLSLSGEISVGILNTNYNELITGINTNSLIPGQFYRISDFATEYISNDGEWVSKNNTSPVINNNGVSFNVDNIAPDIEPLIVLAVSPNKIAINAYSETFPEDIIHYNPFLTYLDGVNTAKGFIVYREDTKRNVKAYYDWRNIRFKRWTLSTSGGTNPITSWQPSTEYYYGDIIERSGTVYKCIQYHTSLFFFQTTFWSSLFNTSTSIIQTSGLLLPDINFSPNGPIEYYGTFDTAFYLYTFTDSTFTRIDDDSILDITINPDYNVSQNYSENLNNIVFYGNSIKDVLFLPGCKNNTFNSPEGNLISRCIFGSGFSDNWIRDGVTNTTFGPECTYNFIYNGFSKNRIDGNFSNNFVEGPTEYNSIDSDFTNNIIGTNFKYNIIGPRCPRKTIKNSFQHNIFGPNICENSLSGINLLSATHVYQPYTCNIFLNASYEARLSYFTETDALSVVSILS